MIEMKNVTKMYGSKKAVDQLSFTVQKGEIFGFLGPNGAGKTTSIRMMNGLLKPTEGEIWVDHLNVLTQTKEVHKKIGVVFELPNLYVRASIEENLTFFGDLYGVSNERIVEVMESLQLLEMSKQKVGKLSKGWKQRVLIARALLHQPEVLFLDEPTSGLDPNTTKLIRNYIKELNNQGTTVVITTHDMHEADELSNRVGIMYQGKLVALDTPDRLKNLHGEKNIVIEYKDGETKLKKTLDMNQSDTAQLIYDKLNSGEIISIHTKEATLSDVFAKLTGSELS